MKRLLITTAIILTTSSLFSIKFYYGIGSGFSGGLGAGLNFLATDLAPGVRLSLEAGGGYFHQSDSGNANNARQIFINDNAGGEIEKHGSISHFYFNLRYQLTRRNDINWYLFGGARYLKYGAYYGFIGDNEAFIVGYSTWGLGGGIALEIKVGHQTRLVLKGGLDSFFTSRFDGHGEFSYDPNKVDDNPRNDYTYEDADTAVNQPKFMPSFMLMLQFVM